MVVEVPIYAGKICDMRTLLKYAKNVTVAYSHETDMPIWCECWLQVSEVFKLHRETLYMCIDYVDRFLSRTTGIKKSQLQLIGITALFVAAKMEVGFTSHVATTRPAILQHRQLFSYYCYTRLTASFPAQRG